MTVLAEEVSRPSPKIRSKDTKYINLGRFASIGINFQRFVHYYTTRAASRFPTGHYCHVWGERVCKSCKVCDRARELTLPGT